MPSKANSTTVGHRTRQALRGFRPVGSISAAAAGDRVYTADQTSNTVSVIDPAANKLLGSIHLGENVPAPLSPPYRGELLVHGLGFSPDHKTLDVVSIGSNSVTLIDTQANTGKGKIYVGRSPHEAFFRPDGRDLWIAVRGEDYVSVIDPAQQKEVRRIETANVKLRFNLLLQVSMNIWNQMECSRRHFGWRLSPPAGLSQVQMVGASMRGYAERICF
jgi:YVTN family beta-propeller protein